MDSLLAFLRSHPKFRSLTHRDSLIAVCSSQSVFALPAVVAAEIPIALAGAVEESQGPPLPVVPSRVRVLGPVAAVVSCDGHALPSPRAGAALIPGRPRRGRAALAAAQTLGGHALPGELRQS